MALNPPAEPEQHLIIKKKLYLFLLIGNTVLYSAEISGVNSDAY